MKTRIYLIKHPNGVSLVRATHVGNATRHIADRTISGALATQDDLVTLAKDHAIEDAAELPPPSKAEPKQLDLVEAIRDKR